MNQNHAPREQAFEDVLQLCLQAVKDGSLTIDACVRQYPQFADALSVELSTANLVSRLSLQPMSSASVNALEQRLMLQAAEQFPSGSARIVRLMPVRIGKVAAAILLAALITFSSGGVVAASADDLPGEPLYNVKRLWENLIAAIAGLIGMLDDVWLQLAETRLAEVVALDAAGSLTDAALQELKTALDNAILYNAGTQPATTLTALMDTVEHELAGLQTPLAQSTTAEIIRQSAAQYSTQRGGSPAPNDGDPAPEGQQPQVVQVTPTWTPTPQLVNTVVPQNVLPSPTPILLTPTTAPSSTPIPPTNTPRFAPTETRTPTPTTTFTPTALVVTATPLPPTNTPVPDAPIVPLDPTVVRPDNPANSAATRPPSAGGSGAEPSITPPVRATPQAVFLTQTAGPPSTEEADGE